MLIIFGRSPYINDIKEYIPELIIKHTTIGINYFCDTFPDVDYVCFYDDIQPKVKDSTIITDINNSENPLIKTHRHELYYIKKDSWRFSEDKSTLNFCVHTPSMALNWAYLKGYKDVVLAGVDLIPNTKHFDNERLIFPKESIDVARKHLETIVPKYLNIYQLNPNSYLNIPKISMEELLNADTEKC